MALLGVILLLAGAGAGVVAYLATRAAAGPITVTAFGFSRDASPFELVLYGAVAVLLFAIGWALLSAAARRRARLRREDRASAQISEIEQDAETARVEHERRFEEAGLRDDDLRRRESELAARHEGLDTREAELSRREAEWREREGPSVADVVTGRAEGSVNDGTASWSGDRRPAETRTGRRADHDIRTEDVTRDEGAAHDETTDRTDVLEERGRRDSSV